MDMTFSAEDQAFRAEVRAFLEEHVTDEVRHSGHGIGAVREERMRWQKILHKKGWVAPAWPKQYGGVGWTETQRFIWSEELARADAPALMPFGLAMVGPVIYTFGTEAQKKKFLPGTLAGDIYWCQGYSEPGSGSDLASLKTRAVLDGDHYVVNGQKIWTSGAHLADWIFCLVRTSDQGKQQEGITFLLIDMKTPGITVKPIILIDGGHEVNETFFDNVRVPVENRIGDENKGWTYAKVLLGHERNSLAQVARTRSALERLKDVARARLIDGVPLIETEAFARKLSEIEIELEALAVTELRALARKGNAPDFSASILKIRGTEIQQRLTELMVEAIGYHAFARIPRRDADPTPVPAPVPEKARGVSQTYFTARRLSIFGGSNEIQHNILAKAALGL